MEKEKTLEEAELEKAEEDLEEADDYNESPPSDIVAFNELRSCADLTRMYSSKQLTIKPDFQRDVVWLNPAKTRFIDSLAKQLPIPSMCLSLDYKTQERLMIDGLQRISTIIEFLTKNDWRLSNLEDVDDRISGKTSGHIKDKNKEIYDRIENLTIPITVLRCDYTKRSHMNYLFTIFHRLNTGGNKLTNQEIRNCIFHGSFNELLKNLVQYDNTRYLLGLEPEKSYRFKYEELFLRVFAFSESLDKYKGKLAKYLNDFMDDKKNASEDEIEKKEKDAKRTIDLLYNKIHEGRQMLKISKAFLEAVMIGIYKNIDVLETEKPTELRDRLGKLKEDSNFSFKSLSEGLSAADKVKARITTAIEIFS